MKVWDQARIEIATPGSAVGLATNCTTGPGAEKIACLLPLLHIFRSILECFFTLEVNTMNTDQTAPLSDVGTYCLQCRTCQVKYGTYK